MDSNSFLNILFSQALMQGHRDIDKAIVDIPNIYNYWQKNNQIFQLIFFVLFISLAFLFIRPKSDHCLVLSVRQSPFWILLKLLDLSKFLNGFLYVVTWICQNWYMDSFKLIHGFVKVVLCISRLFPNKTKLKFDQDFKDDWSFCFELKVLNESKYSMLGSAVPWAMFVLLPNSTVMIIICFQNDKLQICGKTFTFLCNSEHALIHFWYNFPLVNVLIKTAVW